MTQRARLAPSYGLAILACTWVAVGHAVPAALAQPTQSPPDSATPPTTPDVTSPPTGCQDCHDGEADETLPGPPHVLLEKSVHSLLGCEDCHESISLDEMDFTSPRPHGERVERVDCSTCHDEAAEEYKKHGRLTVGTDPDMPTCANCHGTHDILPRSDRQSHVHPANLPSTCRTCHTDVDLVKKHSVLRDAPIKMYENSVHGKATSKGIYVAATCNDCHSAKNADGKRTAHRILGPSNPESTIYHFNIPDTCGQCHESVTRDYWEGIHGKMVKRGATDSPVCTHCHGEHGIISPDDPRSPVSAARLAEETCTPCHESEVLNDKYGISGGRLASYIDSYHGLKSQAGDKTVANCASCHGAHRILPSSDPTSSINPKNLRVTCGECHTNISAELAQTPIHGSTDAAQTGWPDFFRDLYIVLIVATIGLMLLHNGADWIRRLKRLRGAPYVQRMNANEVVQHWILMISFIVLVITGFSLRFSSAFWVKWLFGWEGGFEMRGLIHRVAAVVMTAGAVWHLLYLMTRRGRHWLKDMIVSWRDIRNIRENIGFFIGMRDDPPRFGRFSYIEKTEYWALVWGTVIMTVTGILLWFDDYFAGRWGVPKVVLDVALVIHFYEAWLAFLAIVVWHIYGTVFNPSVYPMNPSWLDGRMPKHMYGHEHPEGPRLKTRTIKVRYEDEVEDGREGGEEQIAGAPQGQKDTHAARPESQQDPVALGTSTPTYGRNPDEPAD